MIVIAVLTCCCIVYLYIELDDLRCEMKKREQEPKRQKTVQFPYQAVIHPVKMLSVVPLKKAPRILGPKPNVFSRLRPIYGDGVMYLSLPPEVHHQLLGLVGVESEVGVLAVLSQAVDFAPIGRLVAVGDQADPCRVIGELDNRVGAVCGHAVMGVQGVEEGA
ncbi:unnamed protein product [Lota lota]